jgi:cytochrome c oxidase subunit 1
MALRRQIRVGSQWMYADEAHKALREAMRVMKDEEQAGGHGHHQPWIRRYVFSTDHKWIGIQYGFTALLFLLLGFCLMILMRLQLGWPGTAFNVMKLLGESRAPGGVLLPEAYNQLGAMHGTIMIFLGIVPLAVGAFGNYLVPLQIGAPDMAFPKLNMASYWCYLPGGLIMLASFFAPGGTAQSGWTSYPPLSVIATQGQTWWLVGMVFLITSSLLGSVNFIVTIIQLRAKGLSYMRFPFFVHAQFVTSFLLYWPFLRSRRLRCCSLWIAWPAPASSCRAGWWSADRRSRMPAVVIRCYGSTCSGSWHIRRFTF